MIYITGDTHGDPNRFLCSREEKTWTQEDTVIICGDFGFLFENNESENAFLDALEARPYTVAFIDGNHENFPAIFSYPEEQWNEGRVHRIRRNILHLMRGQVYNIEGKKIFTFGGGYSRDRMRRKLNVSFWNEELPSSEEYHEAVRNLREHGNRVDIVLTHTGPKGIIRRMGCVPDPHEAELTGFLEYLMYEIQFERWIFGHWHRDEDITEQFTAVYFNMIKL